MSKIKNKAMEEEYDDMSVGAALDAAADSINTKKEVKSKDETNIMSKDSSKEEKSSASKNSEYDKFRKYVNAAGLSVQKKDGSVYLKAEAWLYLAHIKGITPSVSVVPVYDKDDKLVRVTAVCKLYDKDGDEFSQSVMVANKSEAFLKDLDDYAVFGMAETRAISRAVRNVYGYVAKGAGFESTPAIEMGLEEDVAD